MRAAAIDIGSSATKACLFELDQSSLPETLEERKLSSALRSPKPGWFEHDLIEISEQLERLVTSLPEGVPIGFTSAMHGLVLLDEEGLILSPAISWADGRSGKQAGEIGEKVGELHRRTGTPVHPMAWPAKLLWVKECKPEWWERLDRITDLKSYLLEKLTGQVLPLDISSASGTGCWEQDSQSWDSELLGYLDLPDDILPDVALEPFTWNWQGHELHLGAGDGPLGNLGTGAVTPERVAVSLGTSGAVRRCLTEPGDFRPELFRYHLDRQTWVEGGALSNGSSVLEWLRGQGETSPEDVLRLTKKSEIGARGLQVYPYFKGERAPFWRSDITSQIKGKTEAHEFADLCRGTLEGVAYCLNRLLKTLPAVSQPLRCTGGMFTSPLWCQLVADVTGRPVAVSPVKQATALGAALMTTQDYLARSEALPEGRVTEPNAARHQRYHELYAEWLAGDEAMA